jgi:DNA excision repair protein ERCC-6
VLLFCQTQQMLDIIESFVANAEFVYRRMDGNTPINQRMAIIDEFNNSDKVFILILTTKVGLSSFSRLLL